MAGKCSAALVDPPEHATILAALISDFLVTISLGLIPLLMRSIITSPDLKANLSLDS